MTKRRQCSAKFKFEIGREALKGRPTINEIASQHEVPPPQVKPGKKQLPDAGSEVLSEKATSPDRSRGKP